jgi:hypothetical protein
MALTRAQQTILEKARALGSGKQGVALTDDQCKGLVGVIARDLGITRMFPEVPSDLPSYFDAQPPDDLRCEQGSLVDMLERLTATVEDGETYFACLASLHKRRLKYRKILATQPLPTVDEVGPRGLLEYGALPTSELIALLFWRKWMFTIDNRAGQETGYLIEPIIAGAVGGAPAPASKSPVRRHDTPEKGRQVDCVRQGTAYEFKLRVTIAASGQGRWQEELSFPRDCRESGFTPHLLVFDPTPNSKLTELQNAFRDADGRADIGEAAWAHLDEMAGPTMATFLDTYVREPLGALLDEAPETLPEMRLVMEAERVVFALSGGSYEVARSTPDPALASEPDEMPEDTPDRLPGL